MGLMPKYKLEFFRVDSKVGTLATGNKKKVQKMLQLGLGTWPTDNVVIYEYTGIMKGYQIIFNGTPDEAKEVQPA
jgi:hypothetical protein